MSDINSVLKSQSFPSMDVRVAWAFTIVCLVIGLLLTFGVLRVQVVSLPGWAWIAIIVAQAITAIAVAGATKLSARIERKPEGEAASDTPTA